MRKVDVKAILHDLLYLEIDFNPITYISLHHPLHLDLLTGEISYSGPLGNYEHPLREESQDKEDDIYYFYKKKSEWFSKRLQKLGANLEEFDIAELKVSGKRERVRIIFRGEEVSGDLEFLGNGKIETWFSWKDDKN